MEKITVKTGIDASTGLETQVEFSNITIGGNMFPGSVSSINTTVKKQYLKKDGVTIHNEVPVQLSILQDDTDEVKTRKEAAIAAFEASLRSPLTKLITGLV